MNYCEFIKTCHDNPTKVTRLTIREFYALKSHVPECEACNSLVNETADSKPPEFYKGSLN